MSVVLRRDKKTNHKFFATFPDGRIVRFGLKGYSDYTIHKDKTRMERYLTRHRGRENWGRTGGYTPGFWSRWILWSSPSLTGAVKKTEKVLGKKISVNL